MKIMSYRRDSWGSLSPEQRVTLRRFVARRVVHDLGCGSTLRLAVELTQLGADVVAVDERSPPEVIPTSVRYVRSRFVHFEGAVRTAFVSWPIVRDGMGLIQLLSVARTVIYLGQNFGGVACGGRDFWEHLGSRRVLAHMPHPNNALIVYGDYSPPRRRLPEEIAALDERKIYYFDNFYPDLKNVVGR